MSHFNDNSLNADVVFFTSVPKLPYTHWEKSKNSFSDLLYMNKKQSWELQNPWKCLLFLYYSNFSLCYCFLVKSIIIFSEALKNSN